MTTLRGSHSNSATTGTDANVAITASPGDNVIASVHFNGQTTIVDNNGSTPWTENINDYKPNTSGGHTASIFSRRFQVGDPTTLHFTGGASGRWSIVVDVWKDAHPTDIFDVTPSTTNAANADDSSAATINAPSINTVTANAIHVVHGYFDDGTGGNPSGPAGYTAAGADNDEPQGAFYKVIAAAGATGAKTVTGTTSCPRFAFSYAIKDIASSILSKNGQVKAVLSTVDGLAIASVKSINGLA